MHPPQLKLHKFYDMLSSDSPSTVVVCVGGSMFNWLNFGWRVCVCVCEYLGRKNFIKKNWNYSTDSCIPNLPKCVRACVRARALWGFQIQLKSSSLIQKFLPQEIVLQIKFFSHFKISWGHAKCKQSQVCSSQASFLLYVPFIIKT